MTYKDNFSLVHLFKALYRNRKNIYPEALKTTTCPLYMNKLRHSDLQKLNGKTETWYKGYVNMWPIMKTMGWIVSLAI